MGDRMTPEEALMMARDAERKRDMGDPNVHASIRDANRMADLEGSNVHFRPLPSTKDPARSAKFAEYRADPAWEAGFQSVLKNRDQYDLDGLSGAGVRAVGVREDALMFRGKSDSLNEMGRAEALEFLEREAKKTDDRSLIGGMR